MVGGLRPCCARAASGHGAAVLPSSVMNSRRRRADGPQSVVGNSPPYDSRPLFEQTETGE
jgi:hypothetical protein